MSKGEMQWRGAQRAADRIKGTIAMQPTVGLGQVVVDTMNRLLPSYKEGVHTVTEAMRSKGTYCRVRAEATHHVLAKVVSSENAWVVVKPSRHALNLAVSSHGEAVVVNNNDQYTPSYLDAQSCWVSVCDPITVARQHPGQVLTQVSVGSIFNPNACGSSLVGVPSQDAIAAYSHDAKLVSVAVPGEQGVAFISRFTGLALSDKLAATQLFEKPDMLGKFIAEL